MNLLQRIGYYLGGFSLGLILLAFIFNKKKTSCSYGPEARVLKNIISKKLNYNNAIAIQFNDLLIDSSDVKYLLKTGDIDFSKSKTRKQPCSVYHIESDIHKKPIALTVENCDSTATIIQLNFLKSK